MPQKMRIKLSKKIGFCFGVKRAVAMAETALKSSSGGIRSLGSIIHNSEVVEDLSRKGLEVIKDTDGIKGGVVIISSHGLSPKIARKISAKGARIIDTTCPFVSNAQNIAKRLGREGYRIVIVGDAAHPEIKALVDFIPRSPAAKNIFVARDARAARAISLRHGDRVGVLAQTTQSTGNFLDVVKAVAEKRPRELRVFNTICKDAGERQTLAGDLAKAVDVMLIVGGRNSANTKRLFEVSRSVLRNSYLVSADKDLKESWFEGRRIVGITSGASTPDWIIKRVVNKIKFIRQRRTERGRVING